MDASQLAAFRAARRLPDSFRRIAAEHYDPLARWLLEQPGRRPPTLGICGAQGTGKSTLADFPALELEHATGRAVAVLSMDDFYLSRAQRLELSRRVHPLLATRGPPGTHDCAMMERCLQRLRHLAPGASMRLPRFDKARDDRSPATDWPAVAGPLAAIVLEGWCLGVPPQEPDELTAPINELEARHDRDARWRTLVNCRLRDDYAPIFAEIDRLVFLQAPDVQSIMRWRGEQERKLAATTTARRPRTMDETQLETFIQHFERLTRTAIRRLPAIADATVALTPSHTVREVRYRNGPPENGSDGNADRPAGCWLTGC